MKNNRLEILRGKIASLNIDAFLITNAFNRRYMTGFTGSAGYVFIHQNHAVLITDFRYKSQSAEQAKDYRIVLHGPQAIDSIKDIVSSWGIRRLGIESDDMKLSVFQMYQTALPGIELVPVEGVVEQMRGIKDHAELENIRKAVDITDAAFSEILPKIKPGVTEREIAIELDYKMKKLGATTAAFPFIVASGERSALPHGIASDKKLQYGEFITFDFGANVNGYLSDLTRTIFLGEPTEKHRQLYDIVYEANLLTLEAITPGKNGKEIDTLARNFIAGHGFGENFGHGLGHSFGLEIHESIRFSQESKDILQPGMVMTVEPGIYIPGYGGVRIEDDILITDTGIEVLTKSNKEMIVLS